MRTSRTDKSAEPARPGAVSHDAQRVAHLVLGAPRPRARGANRVRRGKAPAVVVLSPGVEEAVALREAWSHKAEGTPQTHAHAALVAGREGALARLVATGAIDAHQLAAAHEIAMAHEAIVADVAVRTARLEPRGSGGGSSTSAACSSMSCRATPDRGACASAGGARSSC